MAIGCLANWHRNSCFHCAITGPLFLIGGVMFLLSAVRMIHVDTHWVGPVLIGIGRVSAEMVVWEASCVLTAEKISMFVFAC
jgi:hypothetical protein